MTRRPGQAASRVLHRLVAGLLALLVVALLGLAAFVWRLGEGPLALPPLARALERAAAGQLGGGSVEIGEAAVAWEGWRGGAAAPLDIRLSGIKLRDADGDVRGELPRASATLSMRALLRGSLAFATVEVRRPQLVVLRRADGGFDLALRPPPSTIPTETTPSAAPGGAAALPEAMDVLRTLALPPSESGGAFAALRRIRVSGGEVVVVDAALDRSWSLLDARIDIRRADAGGLMAEGAATISSGELNAPVRLHGAATGRPMSVTLGLSLPGLRPEQLAAVWPGLGPLSALDASVSLSAAADLDAWGRPERIEAKVAAEPGRLRLGEGHHLPFAALSGSAVTEGRGAPIRLTAARLALPPTDAGPGAELTGIGEASLRGAAWEAALDLTATALPAAALDRSWPEGFEPRLRRAVLGAMPSGTLRGARLGLSLRAPETLGEVELVEARAELHATDAVFDLGRDGRVAVAAAEASASFRPDGLRLERLSARLPGTAPGAVAGPTVTARAGAERRGEGWSARVDVGVDAVRFADLGTYWPEGLAPNVRRWLVQNVTAGEARNGAWRIEAELPETLDAVRISKLSGRAEASGATVHWLRPIPPVQGVAGVAEFSLDSVSLTARGGARQARADTGGRGAIEVREANVRFVGLDAEPGNADISLQVAGPLAEAVAVVKHPRLKLFERKPLEFEVAGGQAEARLRIGFPLLAELPVELLRVEATARIADAQLRGALLGHDLENGRFELAANVEGLKLGGQAVLEGAPVRLSAELDFRTGPPAQVQERATLTGRADPRQLALFGLETGGLLQGPTALEARYERRRSGAGTVALRGDLRDARLVFDPAGWEKPPGTAGAAEAILQLQGDALLSAENMRLDAADLSLRGGRALFGAGGKRLEQVEVAEGRFGASRFAGAVRRPAEDGTAEGEAWRAALRGPLLDLRPFLSSGPAPRGKRGDGSGTEGRSLPIALDLRFDRALAGETGEFAGIVGGAWFDAAGILRALRASGRTAAAPNATGGAFDLSLSPGGARRVLRISAEDGGAFLRAIDVNSISGGRLSVAGAYEELRPGAPLNGVAELDTFVLRDAPAAAKVLQAMTLYGLVEAVQGGDGLVFSRLVAPFALTPDALVLRDARAFSASLGVTAKGRIGRERRVAELEGTIVPAYVFNSLLGRVPLVGRLFSPEAGGGLFAATYRVQGPLDEPTVTVNPLAALTPGFLRGLFGIFDQGKGNGAGETAPR